MANAIEDDGKLLEETKELHQTLNVSSAKKALTGLERAQQREHRVLMASIVFFYLVVFYVLWQRILIRVPFVDSIFMWIRENVIRRTVGAVANVFR